MQVAKAGPIKDIAMIYEPIPIGPPIRPAKITILKLSLLTMFLKFEVFEKDDFMDNNKNPKPSCIKAVSKISKVE